MSKAVRYRINIRLARMPPRPEPNASSRYTALVAAAVEAPTSSA
jgi:hypothetical protein